MSRIFFYSNGRWHFATTIFSFHFIFKALGQLSRITEYLSFVWWNGSCRSGKTWCTDDWRTSVLSDIDDSSHPHDSRLLFNINLISSQSFSQRATFHWRWSSLLLISTLNKNTDQSYYNSIRFLFDLPSQVEMVYWHDSRRKVHR